jgi:deoxyribose-phosphate aldolase
MLSLAKYIDHTLLKPNATKDDIKKLCEEAIEFQFATVCVNPYWVKKAYSFLRDSNVGITTVIGFPLGMATTETKVFETKQAIKDGATEIDMVMNLGSFFSEDYDFVQNDMQSVVNACGNEITLKVILEVGYLNNDQIAKAVSLAKEVNANFVKTSTGFGPGNATEEIVTLMTLTAGENMQVKASGGVRDLKTAILMIESGASRIGTSSGIAIIKGKLGEGY